MSKKSINVDDKKINKSNFYKNKKLFKIDDMDVNKIFTVRKVSKYGVFLVRIFPYSFQIRENTDQKNSVFGQFSDSH